jgi:deoxycytidine triphosphate deaminase
MKHVCGPNTKSDLTGVEPEDIQPNAVDLRLSKVFKILPEVFEIENEYKRHRGSYEIMPSEKGVFYLEPGHYEVIMENKITVGANEAGWVITRSTLNRNGLFLTSGLYDSGYSGVMAGVLHVTIGPAKIRKGTRIGQYLSFNAEMLKEYHGSYGFKSEHDKKYDN